MKTFEQYLRENTFPNKKGPDHSLRATVYGDRVEFYIHPANEGGDTPICVVSGNNVAIVSVSSQVSTGEE